MRISPILQRAPLGAFFLLCLLWTFGSPAWAQTVEETHHKNGSIFERFEVNEAGQKIGSYERFRSDGTLERIATFAEGRLHGTATEFDELTRLSLQANYVRGLRQGTWKEYRDGIPYLSAKYHKDLLQGAWEQFDAQGERHILAHYSKGILHGKFIEERPEGKWGRTANYRDGLLDGKAKITVKRKTVSKRTWKAGQLLNLDGMTPFPVALPQLAATLKEALQPMEPDAEDPMSEERLGELARLKAYRALCGIPWRNLALKPEWNSLCDAAGALCDAIGRLDHTPKKPEGMDDQAYTRGYRGTSSSNLSSGGLRGSVDSYMDDSDPSNIDRLGHRRWCLNPNMAWTGFGKKGRYSAMWSMDSSGPGAKGLGAILYPPAGYVPSDMFGPRHAWSIQFLKGKVPSKKEDIQVSIVELDDLYQAAGESLSMDWKDLAGGGFGNSQCIAFRPVGLKVRPGARYRVTLHLSGDKTPTFDYLVEFCEPTNVLIEDPETEDAETEDPETEDPETED